MQWVWGTQIMARRYNWLVKAGGIATAIAGLWLGASAGQPAFSQSGWWPWATQEEPVRPAPRPAPVPREPLYRDSAPQAPQGYAPSWRPQPPVANGGRDNICLQLEQRLVAENQRGTQSRDMLPKIEAEIRQVDRAARQAQAQLDRNDCYETFLFSRTLRRSRTCVDLANQVDSARRKIADLEAQRQQMLGGQRDRSYQDEIIRELARNNCGATYQQEARRRGDGNPFSSFWQDEDSGPGARGGNQFGALPFATYRTLCVRLCDGYYFPVSFSTLPNHFPRDAEICKSKCAAPVELYYHQNPGGAVEQMVSIADQKPYTSLKSAFRYRKEFVQGCSCKQAEYEPSAGDRGERKAEAPQRPIGR